MTILNRYFFKHTAPLRRYRVRCAEKRHLLPVSAVNRLEVGRVWGASLRSSRPGQQVPEDRTFPGSLGVGAARTEAIANVLLGPWACVQVAQTAVAI